MSFKSTPIPLGRHAFRRRVDRADSDDDEEEDVPGSLSLSGLGLESQSGVGGYTTAYDDCDYEDTSYDDLDPNATRRIICNLIDTCQELEEKQGFQENEDALLNEQVKQSKLLFEKQFGLTKRGNSRVVSVKPEPESEESLNVSTVVSYVKNNTRQSFVSLPQDKQDRIVGDASASAMYLSFKHTKICTGLLRKKVQAMGVSEAVFSVERYLTSLKTLGTDSVEQYSSQLALKNVTARTAFTIKTFPSFPCMFGAFDHQEFIKILDNKDNDVPKDVKADGAPKAKRGKQFVEGNKPAAHEEVNASQADTAANKKNAGEESSIELRRSLIKFCNEINGPANIFQFTVNKDSIRDTLNNTFGVAFGVRDGSIELTHSGGKSDRNKLNISVAPCKPIKKSVDDASTTVHRRQCIISVSSKTLKKLHSLAVGEPVIKPSS